MKTPKYRYLADELGKYYRESGRNRIFRNGLNQNELIEKMAELSGLHDLEASSMTRAIGGKRLLQDYQLEAYCRALNLDEEERWQLWHAALRDRASDFGLDAQLSNAAPVIDILVLKIEMFEEAMADESFRLALTQLANLYTAIEKVQGKYEPTAPLLRVLVLAESERQALTTALAELPDFDVAYEIDLAAGIDNGGLEELRQAAADVPLSTVERDIWHLYANEGLEMDEIAEAVQLTEGTIRVLLDDIKEQVFHQYSR